MLIPSGAHVMIVDGARMSVMRNAGNLTEPRLELVDEVHHRAPSTASIGTDRPGRTAQAGNASRSAMDTTDFHRQAEADFAKVATARLATLLRNDSKPAILVAEPRVLGVMRDHYEPIVRDRLIAEIDKDYAGRTPAEVAEMLERYEI